MLRKVAYYRADTYPQNLQNFFLEFVTFANKPQHDESFSATIIFAASVPYDVHKLFANADQFFPVFVCEKRKRLATRKLLLCEILSVNKNTNVRTIGNCRKIVSIKSPLSLTTYLWYTWPILSKRCFYFVFYFSLVHGWSEFSLEFRTRARSPMDFLGLLVLAGRWWKSCRMKVG